jgi:hypothetical protein
MESYNFEEKKVRRERMRYRSHLGRILIELKIKTIAQLFDSRDPAPFLERDLDDDAVDYILSATMEHPVRTPISLIIEISEAEPSSVELNTIKDAIHNHFNYSAELARRKMARTWRQGQFTFLIGISVLFACLTIARSLPSLSPLLPILPISVIREGLVIMGWVAMWRPFDSFLYSWWPQLEQRRVFKKLAQAPIEFKIKQGKVELAAVSREDYSKRLDLSALPS